MNSFEKWSTSYRAAAYRVGSFRIAFTSMFVIAVVEKSS